MALAFVDEKLNYKIKKKEVIVMRKVGEISISNRDFYCLRGWDTGELIV